ncbi:MAG: hypothetical protein AMXMBFR66_30790 [Pseudomonadota bacterium]|nr:DNA polymerase III subunit chi [Rubrivivax sp.]NLZ39900.1 DNA polymerase III subunit chi [Comamonadaceae bacterium]
MPTEVEFHTGIADPVRFACRLLRKAMRRGASLVCTAPPPVLDELDRALWTFDERDFVPHVRVPPAPSALAARTPIWLCARAGDEAQGRVLVNLGAGAPASAAPFERLIELVGTEPQEAAAARARWRAYQAQGLAVCHHGPGAPGRRIDDERR